MSKLTPGGDRKSQYLVIGFGRRVHFSQRIIMGIFIMAIIIMVIIIMVNT